MRREKNQYIFASELTRRTRGHKFRNAVLLLLPILRYRLKVTCAPAGASITWAVRFIQCL